MRGENTLLLKLMSKAAGREQIPVVSNAQQKGCTGQLPHFPRTEQAFVEVVSTNEIKIKALSLANS